MAYNRFVQKRSLSAFMKLVAIASLQLVGPNTREFCLLHRLAGGEKAKVLRLVVSG